MSPTTRTASSIEDASSRPEVIKFKDVEVSFSGLLECTVIRAGLEDRFWIELPYSFMPEPDLIAFAFAAICGSGFDEIHIDLPLGPEARDAIRQATKARVICMEGNDRRRPPGRQQALNFSGGFDSLAARCLLPCAELVSLDFGGRFSRERTFFEEFSPYTLRTNLVDLRLNRLSWQFMGIGPILLRDELQLSSYSFGSIMAGSLPALVKTGREQRGTGLAIGEAAGLSVLNPVVGLTEIGSMSLAIRAFGPMIPRILRSVALPKEDKYLRKVQMLHAVSKSVDHWTPDIEIPRLAPRRSWGDSFATDLSSLFAMKHLGEWEISSTYKNGIPSAVIDRIQSLDLDFMLRFNPHAFSGIATETLSKWYGTFVEADILPYEEKDWKAAQFAIKLLAMRD